MPHGDAPGDATGLAAGPGHAPHASTHGIRLEWQNPPATARSSLASLSASAKRALFAIGCAGVAMALIATGWIVSASSPPGSSTAGIFEDTAFEDARPAVRATPTATAAAPQSPIVGPDVAPAWNVMQASFEPATASPTPIGALDILAQTAAMPTGSLPPAPGAIEETTEQQSLPATLRAVSVRRSAGLTPANKARERVRNTKWTSTFFND